MAGSLLRLTWTCLISLGLSASAVAQTTAGPTPRSTPYTPPRTIDGQPDLQGVWLSNTATPLERPQALEGRARLTDEEVGEFRRRAERLFRGGNSDFAVGDGVYQALLANPSTYRNPNATHGAAEMVDLEFDNRTSLIVDPADGHIPPVTDAGRARQAAVAAAFERPASAADTGNAIRCISWGVPRLGGRYGAGDLSYYEIVQGPGYVVLSAEAGHEARVIPVDGRPHLPSSIRQWNGDSRGRWDGNTLVVETTNFSSKSFFMGATDNLRVVERFTRTAADRIDYEISVSDPTTWTRPWTAMMPLRQRHETLFEYACHEGNYQQISGIVLGAQAQTGR
jgi:hypothetical protein